MGNCFTSAPPSPYLHPDSTSNRTSNPGEYSGTSQGGFSATSSSANNSHFSAATSVNLDDTFHGPGHLLATPNLKIFSFGELKSATKGFSNDTLLGEGGFGRVYKGWIDEKTLGPTRPGSGMIVAVKKLNSESVQGFSEWQAEVNYLGRLSHPNLVKLLGYCWDDKELLLVYEYLQKGSLEHHLFRRILSIEPLSWNIRLKIAIDSARGLAFLHSSEKLIYRDFKASNILLDGSYNAKLSDFGLVKVGPSGGESHVTTRVMGTQGYAAPEYIATGHLYIKSDVYGFGVVLLEMLTGLRALDNRRPSDKQNLIEWAKPLLSDRRKVKTIMDSRMDGQYSLKASVQAATLTLKCLAAEPRNRPSMKEVVDTLERIEAITEKPKEPKSHSTNSLAYPRPSQNLNNHSPLHQGNTTYRPSQKSW